jgi:two-component system, response regulator
MPDQTQRVQILLVEDNETDAELCIHALKKENLANDLIWLKDGAEALDFIYCRGMYSERNLGDNPNLILLDLRMPKVDGIEVLKELKGDERTKSIPVIVLTSSTESPDLKECYRLGANSLSVSRSSSMHSQILRPRLACTGSLSIGHYSDWNDHCCTGLARIPCNHGCWPKPERLLTA